MTRGQATDLSERMVGVEKDIHHLRGIVVEHAEASKETATLAREDRRAIYAKLEGLVDEIRKDREDCKARDSATNTRITNYEQQAKGGKTILAIIATIWGVAASSMGAAIMYWLKAGSPMPPRG